MKRRSVLLALVILLTTSIFADVVKIAILPFEKNDRKSDYVTSNINSKYFFKEIFKDYENLKLIPMKETAKAVKESGYSNIFYLGKEKIAEIGNKLGADVVVWGNVSSISDQDFKINANILSLKSMDVISVNFNVKKASKPRREAFKKELISKIEEFSGSEVKNMMGIAVQQFQSKNYSAAEESFKRVIEIDAKNVEAYFYLGLINFINKNYEDSKNYYLKGLEIEPENKDLLNYLSNTYVKLDDYDAAIECLEKITDKEDDKTIWMKLGKLSEENEDFEKAVEAYQKAIELDEDFVEAYAALGSLLYEESEFEEAIPYLEKATKAFPESDELQNKLAKCYKQTGKLEDAIKQYQSLIADDPNNIKAYMNLANAYTASEQYQQALDTAFKLKEIAPDNPKVYIIIANCYNLLKNFSEAEKNALKAIEINPELYQPYRILSEVYQARGYKKYENYLELDKKVNSGTIFGKELDDLVEQRDKVKSNAYADFIKSQEYLEKSEKKTSSASELRYIKSRKSTLKQLLEATKKDFF
ncbi:MAG: hypothetical protein DRZ79_00545 [Candidatus Cloacimonadota bacterium]|nr:MAG: hypothetical protein DRZ79_00545 [Candidatus Cloacimonadota bacterium]